MGVIFLIIFFIIFKKSKQDHQRGDAFKYFFFFMLFASIIGSISPLFIGFGVMGLFFWGIYKLINIRKINNNNRRFDSQEFNSYNFYEPQNRANSKEVLSQSPNKRRKIIRKFNELYNLCLTDAQINSIVNASYISEIWKNEIFDMTKSYEVPYQWMNGKTGWLRAYLYVFKVQDINVDFDEQERICAYAFNAVFSYADTLKGMPLNMIIKYVNEKFLTSFDDTTYMIAYRFLEQRGVSHSIPNPNIVNTNSEIDELLKKYNKSEKGNQ